MKVDTKLSNYQCYSFQQKMIEVTLCYDNINTINCSVFCFFVFNKISFGQKLLGSYTCLNLWEKFAENESIRIRRCPRGVIVKAMDCGIMVSAFVLQSRYYVHFLTNTLGKGMNPLILPAMS